MGAPRLWAPQAEHVELVVGDTAAACERDGEHWRAPYEPEPGTPYRFRVDGVEIPDPRSIAQPDGVHGPSERVARPRPGVDGPDGVLDRAVIYELHVGTFSEAGTFLGVTEHLDHLVTLGVTHVELMPVAAFDGRVGWGYDGVAPFATHPDYGTASDLAHLVDECHRRGLQVLLDVVFNHLGPSGNHLGVSGPYFTDRYRTPWGDAVNLDGPWSDGVRRYFCDAALFWLDEVGLDGLRLDAVHALFDNSAYTFLEQLADEVRAMSARHGRRRLLIAESDRGDPRIVVGSPVGPGLDAVWSDDLHHTLHVALTGERSGYYSDVGPGDLELALTVAQTHQGRYSPHRRRHVGRNVSGTLSSSFVVSLQNHDQIGNRAGGERIHHLVGVDRSAAAAALVLLSPFSVLIFQGEEWAASTPFPYFADHAGELGEAVRRGRTAEFAAFGWAEDEVADPQDPATSGSAQLDWTEISHCEHAEVLSWYRSLIELRRTHPALSAVPVPAADQHCERIGDVVRVDRGQLTVLCNLGPVTAERITAPAGDEVLVRGEVRASHGTMELGPGSVMVLDRR